MTEPIGMTVATVGNAGITVHTERFAKVLPDATTVEAVRVEQSGEQWQLLISGAGKDGAGITYHFPVEFTPDGTIRLRARRTKANEENNGEDGGRCVGHNCSRCSWSGSCSCTVGGGNCDHELNIPFAPQDVFLKA